MTTYSIDLDDVDLALLPLRTRSYNDFLKKEHFQFQVMKNQVPEPTSDMTYTCHICAIELPAAFARQHAASIKHRANARIASVAAERTRALITALPPPAAQSTARFCANCATIVDEDHDKTKEHRVAAMHDNLLWELMKAYVGDDDDQNAGDNKIIKDQESQISGINDDKDFKSVDGYNKSNSAIVSQAADNQSTNQTDYKTENTESKTAQHTDNCEIKENKAEASDKVRITNGSINKTGNYQSNSVLPTTSRWAKIETKKGIENGTSKEPTTKDKSLPKDYEKELRKFMGDNVFQIKEAYRRVHITINDDNVDVYSDHFHSFHRVYYNGKVRVECIICDKTFEEKDTEAHKYDLYHMGAVAQIGNDGDYVRKISDTHSHCIICNQMINRINVAKHKQSQYHTNRKENNVRSKATKPKETTENNNVTTTETNYNKTTDKAEIKPVNKDVTIEETVEINKHPYKEERGELLCVVCDCRVPRDLRNRKDHLNGFRHMNNLRTK